VPPSLLICLRHGEKPADAEKPATPLDDQGPGLDQRGCVNRHSLTLRGWARACALADSRFRDQVADADLADVSLLAPDYPFQPDRRRPCQTLLPFARRWHLPIRQPCGVDDVEALHQQLMAIEKGIAVVCWRHGGLEDLAARFVAKPQWPQERFDLLWLIQPSDEGEERFRTKDQSLLASDCPPPAG
jgi:hypothetical protein